MNVNQKGALGLIEVIRDLTLKGYECFTPIHDYSAVDLIAFTPLGKTIRLQVKYREPNKRGAYEISARSIVNGKAVPINKSFIDGWAVYLADIDKVVYLHVDVMCDKTNHYLRIENLDELKILEDW